MYMPKHQVSYYNTYKQCRLLLLNAMFLLADICNVSAVFKVNKLLRDHQLNMER